LRKVWQRTDELKYPLSLLSGSKAFPGLPVFPNFSGMSLKIEEKNLEHFIMVGDRILVKPKNPEQKTASGLILPPSVQENEKILSGYVVKVGPGYPIPAMTDEDEPWKEKREAVKYVPLQAQPGDLAVYLNKSGYEIEFNLEKYIVLPHSAVLMLIRDETLFD
jgi:chaperonin GroES